MRGFIRIVALFALASLSFGRSGLFLPAVFGAEDGKVRAAKCATHNFVLKEGVHCSRNNEYMKADEAFREYVKLEPDDPVGYWRLAYNRYFRLRFEQKTDFPKVDKATYENLDALINLGIEKSETRIRNNVDPDFYRYVQACLYSIRGGMAARNVSWFTARGMLKKTLVLARASGYQDAKYLLGLVNYLGADHPVIFTLAFLPHDRQAGLAFIFESVAQNRGPYVDDIWLVIFKIESSKESEARYTENEVEQLFAYLHAKYPNNEIVRKYLASRH